MATLKHSQSLILVLFLGNDLFRISLKVRSRCVNIQKDTWYLYAHSEEKQSPF